MQLKPDILAAGQKSTRLFPAPDAATPEANRNNPNSLKRVTLIIIAYVALLQVKNAEKGMERSRAWQRIKEGESSRKE